MSNKSQTPQQAKEEKAKANPETNDSLSTKNVKSDQGNKLDETNALKVVDTDRAGNEIIEINVEGVDKPVQVMKDHTILFWLTKEQSRRVKLKGASSPSLINERVLVKKTPSDFIRDFKTHFIGEGLWDETEINSIEKFFNVFLNSSYESEKEDRFDFILDGHSFRGREDRKAKIDEFKMLFERVAKNKNRYILKEDFVYVPGFITPKQ